MLYGKPLAWNTIMPIHFHGDRPQQLSSASTSSFFFNQKISTINLNLVKAIDKDSSVKYSVLQVAYAAMESTVFSLWVFVCTYEIFGLSVNGLLVCSHLQHVVVLYFFEWASVNCSNLLGSMTNHFFTIISCCSIS